MIQKKENKLRPAKRKENYSDSGHDGKPIKSKNNSPMQSQNTILQILNAKGFKHVVPTDDLLQKAEITIRRFYKIIDNKVEMTLLEANVFSAWLGVTIEELTDSPQLEVPKIS